MTQTEDTMRQTLQAALNDFAKAAGLEDLTLSSDGDTAISVDDVEIGITHLDRLEQVHLLSIIGDMPETEGPELAQVLLAANHMGLMTEGAAIGFDAGAGVLTLNRWLPADYVTGATLTAAIESFAAVTLAWRSNMPVIAEIDAGATPKAPGEAAGDAWVKI